MATYPLDFLRAARMSSAASADAAKLGLRAAVAKFSQGLAPEVAKGTLSRVLKFGGFPVAHRLLYDRAPAAGSAASRAAAGALATVPEMALCTPLETGKLALQLDALKAAPAFDNRLQKAAAALTAAAGPAALYAGYCALQCRQAVWTAVYFASRPAFAEAFGALPGATFFSGLGAGVLGAVANCPFDVCRSVAQKELIGAWVSGGEAVTRVWGDASDAPARAAPRLPRMAAAPRPPPPPSPCSLRGPEPCPASRDGDLGPRLRVLVGGQAFAAPRGVGDLPAERAQGSRRVAPPYSVAAAGQDGRPGLPRPPSL